MNRSSRWVLSAGLIITLAISVLRCGDPGGIDGGTGGGTSGTGGGQAGSGGGMAGTGGGQAGTGGGAEQDAGSDGGPVIDAGSDAGSDAGFDAGGFDGGTADAGGCGLTAPYLSAQDRAKSPRANSSAELLAFEATGALVAPDVVYARVDDELAAIKTAYPWLQGVSARPSWADELIVKFDGGAIAGRAADGGYHEWDCLNQMYGVDNLRRLITDWVIVSYAPRLNIPLIVPVYEQLPHVIYAEPNYYGGDGSDICLSIEETRHAYLFVIGSGDCPSGCIEHDFTGVLADGDGGLSLLGRYNPRDGGATLPSWMSDRAQACKKALPGTFP